MQWRLLIVQVSEKKEKAFFKKSKEKWNSITILMTKLSYILKPSCTSITCMHFIYSLLIDGQTFGERSMYFTTEDSLKNDSSPVSLSCFYLAA